MRMVSADEIKKNRPPRLLVPQPGSQIAMVHAFFLRNRGRAVVYADRPGGAHPLEQLRDIWGLDIRYADRGRYVLVGEWFGHRYVDYTRNPSTENVPRDWREWRLNPPAESVAA